MCRRLLALFLALAAVRTAAIVLPGTASAQSEIVCPGQVVSGWIHTNSFFTINVCGAGPIFPTTPPGWVDIASETWYGVCGLRSGVFVPHNIRHIKCLNCPIRPAGPPTPTPVIGSVDLLSPTGDGHADLAVYRPPARQWIIRHSSTGVVAFVDFGLPTDHPVPGRQPVVDQAQPRWRGQRHDLRAAGRPGRPRRLHRRRPHQSGRLPAVHAHLVHRRQPRGHRLRRTRRHSPRVNEKCRRDTGVSAALSVMGSGG